MKYHSKSRNAENISRPACIIMSDKYLLYAANQGGDAENNVK